MVVAAVNGTVRQKADHSTQCRVHYHLSIDVLRVRYIQGGFPLHRTDDVVSRRDFPFCQTGDVIFRRRGFPFDDVINTRRGFPTDSSDVIIAGLSTTLGSGRSFREINGGFPQH